MMSMLISMLGGMTIGVYAADKGWSVGRALVLGGIWGFCVFAVGLVFK